MASPSNEMSIMSSAQQNSYYPETQTDITGDLPMNLDSLRDCPPGSKPFYPYSTLIRYAIKGSPNQKLLLEDIYYAIESRFPYFRTAPAGWKNSVRHNLSLNPCFEKIPRPLTDRGKGSYWTVNDNVDPRTGVHRVRKKRAKLSVTHQQPSHEEPPPPQEQSHEEPTDPDQMSMAFGTPVDIPFTMFNHDAAQMSEAVMQDMKQQDEHDHYEAVQEAQYALEADPGLTYDHTLRPEMDENGNPDWRNIWHNELAKLRAYTEAQEKTGAADPEWYRLMVARVRGGLIPMGGDDLTVAATHHPHAHLDHDIPESVEEDHRNELDEDHPL